MVNIMYDQKCDPRTDADNEIMDFVIKGLNVKIIKHNPFICDAQNILEEFMSEMFGQKIKDKHNLSAFTSLLHTMCCDRDKLIAINLWYGFGFLLDDFLDRQSDDQWFHHWQRVYSSGISEGQSPLDKMFNKVMKTLSKQMNEEMIVRHKYYVCRWLELYRSANEWKDGRVEELTYDQYIDIRRKDTLYEVMLQFAELSAGFHLNEFEFLKNDENYEKFNDFCGLNIVLINDLYSCKKEVKQRQGKFNYIYLKMKTEGIGAQQAVDSIVDEIIESERMAKRFANTLKQYGIKPLSDYCEEALNVVYGNHYWSSVCGRYNDLSLYD